MTSVDNRAVVNRKAPGARLELFPTPPWAVRALCGEVLLPRGWLSPEQHVAEPACGRGHMAHGLAVCCKMVTISDVHPWPMLGPWNGRPAPVGAVERFVAQGFGQRPGDDWLALHQRQADWLITNPPFTLAAEFVNAALYHGCARSVAILARTNWVESAGRYFELFRSRPPTTIVHSADRIPMIEGVWDPEASTATCYSWFVWVDGEDRCPDIWLPPGMARRWTRTSDAAFAMPGEAKRRKAARARGEL